ncbi:hypothetical protein J3R83DRAFT_10232 [Lanmaoa asiatica]|nr:hypothetical protein J3R83DRAFT_10232 [Lanmaoa asiatica]
MEDDAEVLDWGHEEEDGVAAHGSEQRTFSIDDAEDAVSLGGDEEDEFLTYQSRVPQDTVHRAYSPPKSSRQQRQDPSKAYSDSPRQHHSQEQPTERTGFGDQSSLPGRTLTFGTLVHALPPKPVVSSVPFVYPSHPSIIEATAMASRADRDKRNGAASKASVHDHNDSLPPGWEVKYPRNGRGVYYYNIHTQESTWTRPTAPNTREKRGEWSDRRDDPLDKPLPIRNDEILIPRVGRAEGSDMSYDDRHYRPGETTRREERPAPSTQRIDSYVPDSYSPNHRNSRPSPPPPRTRERDPTPPPRRPLSPDGSYGDCDGVQSSYREAPSAAALSAQDRVWVARDVAPQERPNERRQRDDLTLSETEHRNPPRDAERSSTLSTLSASSPPPTSRTRRVCSSRGGGRSISQTSREALGVELRHMISCSFLFDFLAWTHGRSWIPVFSPFAISLLFVPSFTCLLPSLFFRAKESANTTPHSSIKPSQPVLEAPAGKKSRFSQADGPVHPRDVGIRRARTDDVVSLYVDDVPSSRSMADVRGDNDTPTHPASDAQRPESRKRTPLPPQGEVFRPGARPASTQRSGGYSSGPTGPAPASVAENRHTSQIVPDDTQRDLTRRSPSPPPPPPAERGDRDSGRSRWSKLHANGPLQMDSQITHESSRGRAHDAAMDVDDAPLPRSSDPPVKLIPPRRPALQDEVPRYPRAMLNSDNDGPPRVGVRETRDGVDSRYRFAVDDSSRLGPSRERLGMERHSADQNISQKEPNRGVEARPPPSGSNIKLSGTNNIPIGTRNKFAGNVPPPSVPPSSAYRTPTVISGSNGEPSAPRRGRANKDHERPPHLDGITCERGAPMEPARREDARRSPLSNPRALPPAEPIVAPTRPSRAALGISRFGPPIVKENNTEPARSQMNVSSESLPSSQVPEGSSRATPPPISRESSMASFKDVAVLPDRPSHLPPRPPSPPRGYRYRSGDTDKPHHRPNARSPVGHDSRGNEANAEALAHPRPSSPAPWKRTMDAYPSEPPPAPRDNRDVYSQERSGKNFRDSEANHHVARPPPPPVAQDEDCDRAPPPMHPERALMLQANGLPPRPPSVLGRARSARGPKRDKRDDRDHDRAEPLRGNSRGPYDSTSPGGNQRRYPEDDRVIGHGGGGGGSLLDRLTLDDGNPVNSSSLRDRVELPSKRDREEMLIGDFSFDTEGDDTRRVRRRGGARGRKGRV